VSWGRRMRREHAAMKHRRRSQHREWGQQQNAHHHGAATHGFGAQHVPHCRRRDQTYPDPGGALARRHGRQEVAQVADEQRGIERHVEDAAHQRQPGFLKSPEAAHAALHPDIIAAVFGQCAGQFAHHQRGGKAPQRGREQQDENGAAVARHGNRIFQPERPAGNDEIGRRDQRQQRKLACRR